MSRQEVERSAFRVRGWHVATAVTAFFVVIAAVDGTFAMMAVRTFPGEVSVTPYEDGLAYNSHLAQQRRQAALGWRAAAAVSPAGEVIVELRDRAGTPLSQVRVSGDLQRPATEAGRLSLAFDETAPGRYVAHPAGLSGAWDLTLVARDADGGRLEAERRLKWP